MRKSLAKARTVLAQEDQATALKTMQAQLDRIEAKLDKALGISKKKQGKQVDDPAEPTEPIPEGKA